MQTPATTTLRRSCWNVTDITSIGKSAIMSHDNGTNIGDDCKPFARMLPRHGSILLCVHGVVRCRRNDDNNMYNNNRNTLPRPCAKVLPYHRAYTFGILLLLLLFLLLRAMTRQGCHYPFKDVRICGVTDWLVPKPCPTFPNTTRAHKNNLPTFGIILPFRKWPCKMGIFSPNFAFNMPQSCTEWRMH